MSPDRDPGQFQDDGRDLDDFEDDAPRSIFSALWFRALLAVLVLGVLGAVAVPYVLDFATAPAVKTIAAKPAAPATASTPAVPAPAAPAARPTPAPATAAPAATAEPAAPPTPARKSEPPSAPPPKSTTAKAAPAKPAASKPAVVAKAGETSKRPAKPVEPAKPAAAKAPATKPEPASAGGPFWVQVGAFKDPETAKAVAVRLRGQGLHVEESTTSRAAAVPPVPPARAPGDRYDVVVSGASATEVDAKLKPKGLSGEPMSGGIVVRPSLALRDAVALSRELADAGLSVQVRRVGGPAPSPSPAPPPASAQTLHRVRVGGYPDRATAVAAMKQLEGKGFTPFVAREGQ